MVKNIENRNLKKYKKENPNDLNKQEFKRLENGLKNPRENVIEDQRVDYLLWLQGKPSRAEQFANYVMKKINNIEGMKILEVGSGRTANVAKILSKRGAIVTCIDPRLESKKVKGNIKCIKKEFNYQESDISFFDYVIAQEPCEGAEHVIRACKKANKPFILTLCGTPHKTISGKQFKSYRGWHKYLKNIDPENLILKYESWDTYSTTSILLSKSIEEKTKNLI